MRRLLTGLLALALAASLTACGHEPPQDDGRLRVVCTLFPYYDFARQIGGDAVDVVDVPALNVDESYARDPETGEWSLTYEATPTMANLRENYAQLYAEAMDVGAQVVISEAMASNKSYLAAQGCPDWIELSNLGETDVDLTGWRIGDDPEDPNSGFALPQTVLGPGEYLLIYADGKNCVD